MLGRQAFAIFQNFRLRIGGKEFFENCDGRAVHEAFIYSNREADTVVTDNIPASIPDANNGSIDVAGALIFRFGPLLNRPGRWMDGGIPAAAMNKLLDPDYLLTWQWATASFGSFPGVAFNGTGLTSASVYAVTRASEDLHIDRFLVSYTQQTNLQWTWIQEDGGFVSYYGLVDRLSTAGAYAVTVSDTESDFAVTRLNADGTFDKTTIVVLADHGFRFGGIEHDARQIPFIVKKPQQTERAVITAPVQGEQLLKDTLKSACRPA